MATSPTPPVGRVSTLLPNASSTILGSLFGNATNAAAAATGAVAGTALAEGNSVARIGKQIGKGVLATAAGLSAAKAFSASPAEVIAARGNSLAARGTFKDATSQNPLFRIYIINTFQNSTVPVVVKAWIPEQVSVDVSATYSALFGQGLFQGDDWASQGLKTFGFSGLTRVQSFKIWNSSQGITMTLPLVFTMDDTAVEADIAGREPSKDRSNFDITAAILELQKLCLPSQIKGQLFLEPPGSTLQVSQEIALNRFVTDIVSAAKNVLGITDDTKKDQGPQAPPGSTTPESSYTTGNDDWIQLRSWTSVYIGNFLYFDKVVMENVGAAYDMQLDENGKPMRATVNVTFSTLFDTTIQDLNSIYLTGKVDDSDDKNNPQAKA